MLRLIGLLLLLPLLDAILLVIFGWHFGWQLMVLTVVLTALLGLLLTRAESRHTIRKIQKKAASGEAPTDELVDGALLIAAGAFLLTPGLITDALGLLFVVPVTRYPIRWALKKYVLVPFAEEKTDGFVTGSVYIGGFPGEGGPSEEATTDRFDDAQDVDFEEVDEGN